MTKPQVVRDLEIGAGLPKIIVPLTGADTDALLSQVDDAVAAQTDLVEWRVDYFDACKDIEAVLACLATLRDALGNMPLLFTARSYDQGGKQPLDLVDICALNRAAISSGAIDLVDIELNFGDQVVHDLVAQATSAQVVPVISYHNFASTPSFEELYATFKHEYELGAGIAKVACMANAEGDELNLMAATNQFANDYPNVPLLGISMGEIGTITRLAGDFFGSDLTFCTAGVASAPGQVSATLARSIIAQLHEEGYNPTSTE